MAFSIRERPNSRDSTLSRECAASRSAFRRAPDGEARGLQTARANQLVEMGESRTPRPEPFVEAHYERVRWFVVDRPDGHRHPAGRSSHVPLDRA